MSRRRPSLMDILEEEQANPPATAPVSTPAPVSDHAPVTAHAPVAEPAPLHAPKPNKADYIRLSITVPPDMFERLQAVSLERRRAKEPYTFCHLARQAMLEWLDRIEEEQK